MKKTLKNFLGKLEKPKNRGLVVLVLVVFVLAVTLLIIPKNSLLFETQAASILEAPMVSTVATSVADSLAATPTDSPKNTMVSPKILMYHHIGSLPDNADSIRKGLTVSAENFDLQLKFLKDNGYTVVTLAKMYEMVIKGEDVSKVAVLTFDDGYSDNFSVALPALQKYGYKGTFFIITGKIGKTEGTNQYLIADQITQLARDGNEIGSHTLTHPDLSVLKGSRLHQEIFDSKTQLEALTGSAVVSFCYPSGKYSTEAEKDIAAAGYLVAVDTKAGAPFSTGNLLELPRYRVNPTTDLSKLLK
jgi:peptidoglycan/xylan/chitin deacetylase (PgdA/CDA1 family)